MRYTVHLFSVNGYPCYAIQKDGKTSVCPFAPPVGLGDADGAVYQRCDDLEIAIQAGEDLDTLIPTRQEVVL